MTTLRIEIIFCCSVCRTVRHSSAINHSTSETIAIKKLYRPLDSKLHSKRAHRELQLLAHLRSDQSNVSLCLVYTIR